ncbi:unnamed protein product [Ambrosiozyma monospora]|uniref:Unnamed protein product n=1 Tax=Ambrosiozyma monospora TaxID=43982 RepID=A0A9W6YTQ8_AMBMO|nr:unnamed protein product [Ambrosiozyma monospora]
MLRHANKKQLSNQVNRTSKALSIGSIEALLRDANAHLTSGARPFSVLSATEFVSLSVQGKPIPKSKLSKQHQHSKQNHNHNINEKSPSSLGGEVEDNQNDRPIFNPKIDWKITQFESVLKEACHHLSLPADLHQTPVLRIATILHTELDRYHRDREGYVASNGSYHKKKKRLHISKPLRKVKNMFFSSSRFPPDTSPESATVEKIMVYLQSNLVLHDKDRKDIKELLQILYNYGVALPEGGISDIVNGYRKNLKVNLDLLNDTEYILRNSKPLSEFGSFCINVGQTIMGKHTFTKFEFDVFWKSVKFGWDKLSSQDRKEMCVPLIENDAANDSFDLFIQHMGDDADADSCASGSDIEDDLIDCFSSSTRFEDSKAKKETYDSGYQKKKYRENDWHPFGDDGRFDDAKEDEINPFVVSCAGVIKYPHSSSDDETKYPSSDDGGSSREKHNEEHNVDLKYENVKESNKKPTHSFSDKSTANSNSSSKDETRLQRSSLASKVTNETNYTPLTSIEIHSQETLLRPSTLKNCEVYNHVMDLKKEKIVFCDYKRIDPIRPDPVVQTIADRLKEKVVEYYQGRYQSTQYFKPKIVSSVLILPSQFYKNISGPDTG